MILEERMTFSLKEGLVVYYLLADLLTIIFKNLTMEVTMILVS